MKSKIQPKYSIIIPTYNGVNYLPTCIETVISQEYEDYELIISDDHSTDGTREYLNTLEHPNISILSPPESLSMTEHWEWALTHAKGEWQIFLGQDDGLQPYFFPLAEVLTKKAKEKKVRAIMSKRAYFFWNGCQQVYGDVAVGYSAENKVKTKSLWWQAILALLSLQDYFELPQMYTTSLFHKDLLAEARLRQLGKVFSCHPQDANLAAIAVALERKYLKSYIPLGWVGTSPKSAGMAISNTLSEQEQSEGSVLLKKDYLKKISKSKIKYHELAGNFALGSNAIYFWQALLMTDCIQKNTLAYLLSTKSFKSVMFARVLCATQNNANKKIAKGFNSTEFKRILCLNSVNYFFVICFAWLFKAVSIPAFFVKRVLRRIKKSLTKDYVAFNMNWINTNKITLKEVNATLKENQSIKKWISGR